MDDVVKESLHDILTAIDEVESFFGGKPKLFEVLKLLVKRWAVFLRLIRILPSQIPEE